MTKAQYRTLNPGSLGSKSGEFYPVIKNNIETIEPFLLNCSRVSVFFYDKNLNEAFVKTTGVLEIHWYSFIESLADIGGFSKTIGILLCIIIWKVLSREVEKKLESLDPEHKKIFSYESIRNVYKDVQ